MNTTLTFALIATLVCALGLALRQILNYLQRPLSRQEINDLRNTEHQHRSAMRAALREGKAPQIHVVKKYGPLGVRGFRAADYLAHMRRMARREAFANVAEGFYKDGRSTFYPSDVVPNNSSNPYNQRYLLVKLAPYGTALGASIAPGWTVLSDDIVQIMAAADISIPLGFMTDDVGNAALDTPPYSGTVQMLGNASSLTIQGVTDKQIFAGQLLIPSLTVAGEVGVIPNIAGVYWCVGLAISTSEGAGTLIEIDASRFPISVDEIT